MGFDAIKPGFGGWQNNKGADQPVHSYSLINTFVIYLLEWIILGIVLSEISIVLLTPVAERVGSNLFLYDTMRTGLSR